MKGEPSRRLPVVSLWGAEEKEKTLLIEEDLAMFLAGDNRFP